MKTLVLVLLCHTALWAQSIVIEPTANTNTEVLKLNKSGMGLDHRLQGGGVGMGTFVSSAYGYLQTHTNHPLAFSTNNGTPRIFLNTDGKVGIGNTAPEYLLDISGRTRIRSDGSTAGIWFSKTNNAVNQGSFFGNVNDSQAGVYIGNAWRVSISETGQFNLPSLAGSGIRNVAADASGNLVINNAVKTSFSVGIAATVSVSNEVERALDVSVKDYDVINNIINDPYGPDYFKVTETGAYHCTFHITWQGNATGSRKIIVRDQTTLLLRMFEVYPGHAQPFFQSASADFWMEAGKEYKLYVSQNSGTSLQVFANPFNPYVWSCFKQ